MFPKILSQTKLLKIRLMKGMNQTKISSNRQMIKTPLTLKLSIRKSLSKVTMKGMFNIEIVWIQGEYLKFWLQTMALLLLQDQLL